MRTSKDRVLVKEWLAADADPRQPSDALPADGVSCDEDGCFVALTLKPEALADDCARAMLLVTTRQVPARCAAINAQRNSRIAGRLAWLY